MRILPAEWRHPGKDFWNYSFWPVLLLMGAFFLSLIGTYWFIGPEEPRYTRIPEEMADRGDWVVPVLKGQPWMEKPPLLYWGVMGSQYLFGRNTFSARFPSALLALGIMGLLYWALAGVYGRRTAFFSSLVLGTAGLFTAFSMANVMDIHLTATAGAGLLLFWRAWLAFEGKVPHPHPTLLLWGACAAFGLASLAKGLLSLAIPLLVIGPFLALAGGWRHVLHPRLLPGLALFLAVSVPWHMLMVQREGFHFVLIYFVNHHLARFFTSLHHHSQPFFYYLPVLVLGLFPWTPFLFRVRGLRDSLRQAPEDARSAGVAFFLCWAVFPFLFFSASTTKLAGYVLPIFPALAFLTARGAEGFVDSEKPERLAFWSVFLTPAAIGLAVPVFTGVRFGLPLPGALFGLLFLAGALPFLLLYRKGRRAAAAAACSLMILVPAGLGIPALFETFEPEFNRRQICETALHLAGPNLPVIVYQHQHHSIDYYLGYASPPEIKDADVLNQVLLARKPPVYVLTLKRNYSHIYPPPGWRKTPLASVWDGLVVRLEPAGGSRP